MNRKQIINDTTQFRRVNYVTMTSYYYKHAANTRRIFIGPLLIRPARTHG